MVGNTTTWYEESIITRLIMLRDHGRNSTDELLVMMGPPVVSCFCVVDGVFSVFPLYKVRQRKFTVCDLWLLTNAKETYVRGERLLL